jgi:5-formyltetrahydrofolate cyclo-ligase
MDLESKESIRNKLIAKRKHFNSNLYQKANGALFTNLVTLISELLQLDETKRPNVYTGSIGLYWPMHGEPDLLKLTLPTDTIISLPKIIESEMIFVEYHSTSTMEKSSISTIYQPESTIEIIPKLIIVPGLGFSKTGCRIGFGRGYYDKYLNKISQIYRPITIGVCFHEYLFEHLPQKSHDYQMDYIITDLACYTIKLSNGLKHLILV